jgi:hypothetical protein
MMPAWGLRLVCCWKGHEWDVKLGAHDQLGRQQRRRFEVSKTRCSRCGLTRYVGFSRRARRGR